MRYLSQIITAREQEILDAMLYFIQTSGLSEYLRKGVVITGGGAEMLHIGNFLRDISGYTVRTGYPKGGFVATGCEGILSTDAVCTAGMVLLAKEDNLNCCAVSDEAEVEVAEEEPVVAEEPAAVETVEEVAETEEVPEEREEEPVEEEKKEDGGKKEKKSRDGIFSRVRWKVANIFNEMDNENV